MEYKAIVDTILPENIKLEAVSRQNQMRFYVSQLEGLQKRLRKVTTNDVSSLKTTRHQNTLSIRLTPPEEGEVRKLIVATEEKLADANAKQKRVRMEIDRILNTFCAVQADAGLPCNREMLNAAVNWILTTKLIRMVSQIGRNQGVAARVVASDAVPLPAAVTTAAPQIAPQISLLKPREEVVSDQMPTNNILRGRLSLINALNRAKTEQTPNKAPSPAPSVVAKEKTPSPTPTALPSRSPSPAKAVEDTAKKIDEPQLTETQPPAAAVVKEKEEETNQHDFLNYFGLLTHSERNKITADRQEKKRLRRQMASKPELTDYVRNDDRPVRINSRKPILFSPTITTKRRRVDPPPPSTVDVIVKKIKTASGTKTVTVVTNPSIEDDVKPLPKHSQKSKSPSSTNTAKTLIKPRFQHPAPAVTKKTQPVELKTCIACNQLATMDRLSACIYCYNFFHLTCHKVIRELRERENICPPCLRGKLRQKMAKKKHLHRTKTESLIKSKPINLLNGIGKEIPRIKALRNQSN